MSGVRENTVSAARDADLVPYLPRLVRAWSEERGASRSRVLDGSLVSADVSGFTALSERLAARGREGAEELVETISSVFDGLIQVAERHGGDVLKFRGDALLLLLVGDRHPERACGAASDMQRAIGSMAGRQTSVGAIELRMACGVHSGDVHVFLTEVPQRELLVAGRAASRVFALEDLAEAGEVVLSAETAAKVDPAWLAGSRDDGQLLHSLPDGASPIPPPEAVGGRDLPAYVPRALRDHLAVASGEAEHRQVTVAFVKASGTDAADDDPEEIARRLDALAGVVADACGRYGLTWLESDIDTDAAKVYLTAGAPSTTGQDEEAMLRALRDIVAADVGLPLKAGVNRGRVFTGDIGSSVATDLRRHGRRGQSRGAADRPRGAGSDPDDGGRPGSGAHDVRDGHRATAREGQGGRDPGPHARRADRLPPAVDCRCERRSSGGSRSSTPFATRSDARGCASCSCVELVADPGVGKSRIVAEARTLAIGFQQLDVIGEPYAKGEPFAAVRPLLRQLVGITADAPRDQAGQQLALFVGSVAPDLAAWLPLLALPFDAELGSTPEVDALDPAAARDRRHEAARDADRTAADDAHPARSSRTCTGSTTHRSSSSRISWHGRRHDRGSSSQRADRPLSSSPVPRAPARGSSSSRSARMPRRSSRSASANRRCPPRRSPRSSPVRAVIPCSYARSSRRRSPASRSTPCRRPSRACSRR